MREIYNPENYIKTNGYSKNMDIFIAGVQAVTAVGIIPKEAIRKITEASFEEILKAKDPNFDAKKLAALVSGVVGATEDQSKFKGEEKQ